MASYPVTIITLSTPAVTASGSGISYQELINSFGYYNFLVQHFFIQAKNIPQLQQTFMFDSYDSTGQRFVRPMSQAVDPYQKQASLYAGVKDESVIINSRTNILFPFLPLESMIIQAFAKKNYIGDFLVVKNKLAVQSPVGIYNQWAKLPNRPVKKAGFTISIKNNTNSIINVSLLSQSENNGIFNAITEYQWNLTNENYTNAYGVQILVKTISESGYTAYTASLVTADADGVINALNSLGVGIFWKETTGGYTFINTTSETLQYSTLIVQGSAAPIIPPTTVFWQNNTLVAGGSLNIDKNSINVVNDPNASFNQSSFAANNGDDIDVNVQASPLESTYWEVTRTLIAAPFTTTTLYSNTVAGSGTDSYSFTVDADFTYQITWGSPP